MEQGQTQEKTELQELIDRIDRNSEDWAMILHWRDVVRNKFLKHAMSDTPNELDSDEFNEYLDQAAKYAHDLLENPSSITEQEIKKIVIGTLSDEWDKKAEIVLKNIEQGSTAINDAKDKLIAG